MKLGQWDVPLTGLLSNIQQTFYRRFWGAVNGWPAKLFALSDDADQLAGASAQQSQAVSSSAAALEQISTSIEQVSGMVDLLAHEANQAQQHTQQGEQAVGMLALPHLDRADHVLSQEVNQRVEHGG